jgi:hypothetical protein
MGKLHSACIAPPSSSGLSSECSWVAIMDRYVQMTLLSSFHLARNASSASLRGALAVGQRCRLNSRKANFETGFFT